MSGFPVLLRKELVEQWRTMRLPSFLAVFLFVGIASPAAARYLPKLMEAIGGASFAAALPPPTIADAYAQVAKNVAQIGALVMVIVSMTALSTEQERGTLAFILSKPVTRSAFVTAKLIALATTAGLGMLLAGASAYMYTAILFGPPGPAFILLCVASFLSLVVYGSVTVSASVMTRSAAAAGGAGVSFLVASGMASMLPGVGTYTPTGALSRTLEVVAGANVGVLVGPLLAQVGIIAVAWVAALLVFDRQEV